MPNAAVLPVGNAAPPQQGAEQPIAVNAFVRASSETRQIMDDTTTQMLASSIAVGPIDVPAIGFLRAIVIYVEATGGTGGSPVFDEDAPWNALDDVRLTDTNGTPLFGPMNGYHLYLCNKYGAYTHGEFDPANFPSFSSAVPNFNFKVKIPVEITSRDGLGALPNLTSAATYKYNYTVAASTVVYSTVPTTLPSLRVRIYVESWAQPMATDAGGVQNETQPPRTGTTQFWSQSQLTVSAGEQRLRVTKMGNHIRNMLFVFRDGSGDRDSTNFPDENRIEWDNKIYDQPTKVLWRDTVYERYGFTNDTGVFPIDLTHDADGVPGNENRHLWLKTVSGTRFEIIGNYGAAGVLTVLINDIAVRGAVRLSSGMAAN